MNFMVAPCLSNIKHFIVQLMQTNYKILRLLKGDRGGAVVKVLCYKSEGRWFDSSWCHWNFSFT